MVARGVESVWRGSSIAARALALLLLTSRAAQAAPGGLLPDVEHDVGGSADPPPAGVPTLTPHQVWNLVGIQLVKQHVLLAMQHLRVEFRRDDDGVWQVLLNNTETGCNASRTLGHYDFLTEERARAVAFQVMELMQRSGCGGVPGAAAEEAPRPARLAPWVRPTGAVYAATSLALLAGISTTEPPNLSLSFRHAPSALVSSGFMLGAAGGVATLVVPERAERPLLELTVASSMTLQLFGVAGVPEPGLSAYGEYAAGAGYALSSALLAADWALSRRPNQREAPDGTLTGDAADRAISPVIAYAPAVLGGLISLSRALSPHLGASDRELALGLGTYELLPALTGFTLGLFGSHHRVEKEPPEPWIAGGPRGSLGLTLGGTL